MVWDTGKCSSRAFLCLWMAGGTSSPALGATARPAHPTRKKEHEVGHISIKMIFKILPGRGAVLKPNSSSRSCAAGRALRLFWTFLLLAEGMGKPEKPRNKSSPR